MSIVSYSPFRKWFRQIEDGAPAAKPAEGKPAPAAPGRPKTEESIRNLISRTRVETGWVYTKIR